MTNLPSPYAVDFFNMLGEKHDLTVIFERKDASNRVDSWFDFGNLNYLILD